MRFETTIRVTADKFRSTNFDVQYMNRSEDKWHCSISLWNSFIVYIKGKFVCFGRLFLIRIRWECVRWKKKCSSKQLRRHRVTYDRTSHWKRVTFFLDVSRLGKLNRKNKNVHLTVIRTFLAIKALVLLCMEVFMEWKYGTCWGIKMVDYVFSMLGQWIG